MPKDIHSVVLDERTSLLVTDSDSSVEMAGAFLNDLLTLDVNALSDEEVRVAALLTPQGRIAFELLVSRVAGGFRLEIDKARLDALTKQLTLYRMRLAIAITPSNEAVVVGFGDAKAKSTGWLVDSRFAHTDHSIFRRYGDGDSAPSKNKNRYTTLRYQNAIPEGEAELPSTRALPLEAGFDRMGGISFDKGCFIGQEVTARIHHRGLSKQRYIGVRCDTLPASLTPPSDIRANDKLIGTLLGVVASDDSGDSIVGLAVIRREALASTPPLVFMAGECRLTPLI